MKLQEAKKALSRVKIQLRTRIIMTLEVFPRLYSVIRKSASTPKFTYIDPENVQSKQDSRREIKKVQRMLTQIDIGKVVD